MTSTPEFIVPIDEPPPSSPVGDDDNVSRRSWLVLFTVLAASMMDLLDATIVNVAAPSISRSLDASAASLQWIITSYTLTFSVMLITGGRLGDVAGRKNVFVAGLGGFIAASALCSLAQSPAMLIGSRVVQGGFAALMVPQAFALIKAAFKPAQVASAFAVFGPFMGLSAMLGPVLGGALVTVGGWRWIFLINVPAGLATIVAAVKVLPAHEARRGAVRLDLTGMALATAAVLLLVYPLVEGRPSGWPSSSFAMMAVSAPVLVVFALHQRARRHAGRDTFIETSLFRNRAFCAGVVTVMLFFGTASGVVLVNMLVMQEALHFSALHAGLTLIWWSLGTIAAMVGGTGFVQRVPRRVLQTGLITMAAGLGAAAVSLEQFGASLNSWTFAPALFTAGVGMGLVFAPFFGIVLAAVGDTEIGAASGLVNAVNQFGGAVGIAVLGTVFFCAVPRSGMLAAGQQVYWIGAATLVVTWAVAFAVPAVARPESELR